MTVDRQGLDRQGGDRSDDTPALELEFSLDMPRLVLLLAVFGLLLATAFVAGRISAPTSAPAPRDGSERSAGSEDASGTTIFDRDPAAPRGGFELDLGGWSERAAAEARRTAAHAAGVEAVVSRAADGSYRVAAGPFTTRAEAERLASRLRAQPGPAPRVVPLQSP